MKNMGISQTDFLLNPEEIQELRKQKYEITEYAKEKLKKLIQKQETQND